MKKLLSLFGVLLGFPVLLILSVTCPLEAYNQNNDSIQYPGLPEFPDEHPRPDYGYIFALKGEVLFVDFNEFLPLIGEYNKPVNFVDGNGRFEYGLMLKKHYLGVNYGASRVNIHDDSLKIKFNTHLYGLSYGYNIINSWRFTIRPMVALQWYRARILNTSKSDDIPINQYLQNRQLDIRFNQPLGFIGMDVALKSYGSKLWRYTTFGVYVGYVHMFGPTLVYSPSTHLTNTPNIEVEKINFTVYIATNFDFHSK